MSAGTLTPVAGDSFVVNETARSFESVAAHVAATSSRLRALAGTSWTGAAAVRSSTRTATLPPRLDKVEASYSSAGAALRSYATALADAQARSTTAIRTAESAQAEVEQLRTSMATASPETLPSYDASIAEAETRLARAVASNSAAHDDQRRAASLAARKLHEASAQGIKNQSWWRHVLSGAAEIASTAWTASLRVVARVATAISALAGLAALAMSLAGLVFPPLEGAAALLEAVSLVSGVVAASADTALAASGKGSWKAVGVDAVALAPWAGSRLITRASRVLSRPTTVVYASSRVTKTSDIVGVQDATTTWRDTRALARHFRDHGADFEATSPSDYATQAERFLRDAIKAGHPMKVDEEGVIRVYDRMRNTFGSYNPDGSTRTFFKPTSATYWERQPGIEPWSG